MQSTAFNIKTSLVFFIRGTITNLQILLNTPKNPYLNQATQKILAKIFLPKKYPEIENLKPKTIIRSSLSLEIRSKPLGF